MLHDAPPDRSERRAAALLQAGGGAILTGLDALDLHGMRRMPQPSGPVHVLVPAGRRRAGTGLVLAPIGPIASRLLPGRWPLAPIVRSALDAALRSADRDEVRALLAEVVQRGRCSPAQLHAELAQGSGRGVRLPREVLVEISDGVRSGAEADARRWHLSPGDYARTLERRSAMMAEGIVVLHTSPSKLARRAAAIEELRRTHEHAGRAPRPQVIAIPPP